ncbi:hypothetical protein BJY01DRAFT_106152 [Aspergillus pseudoustus]|uniref:DUF3074 domain-containing protein n=1 Tax=Aspergillus pseudoustus TaxID=1810923 RepID=A0ABR4IV95_9EURO
MCRSTPSSKRSGDEPPNYDEATRPSQSPITIGDTSDDYDVPQLAMMSFAWTDRVRLLRFPEPIVSLICEVLRKLWPKGIQKAQDFDESLEIKLRGNPFHHGADDEKLAIRISLMGILNELAKEGWVVLPGAGGRVTRLGNYAGFGQKDSWIFTHQEPQSLSWLCVSFVKADLLHLINAPSDLATSLLATLGGKVEKCNQDHVSGSFEVKFKQTPWAQPTPKGAIQSRILALDLAQCLSRHGYRMCTGLDLDGGIGGINYQSTGEVWFWCR